MLKRCQVKRLLEESIILGDTDKPCARHFLPSSFNRKPGIRWKLIEKNVGKLNEQARTPLAK